MSIGLEAINALFALACVFGAITALMDASATFEGLDAGFEEGNPLLRPIVHWAHETGNRWVIYLMAIGVYVLLYKWSTFAISQMVWMPKEFITGCLIIVTAVLGVRGLQNYHGWKALLSDEGGGRR